MRVIAGTARGVHLNSPRGIKTRPIQDKIKASLFNILSGIIQDSRVLDLFAGTGAIGIEALSRGAKFCIFIDNDTSAIQVIKKNLEATRLQDKAQVIKYDVFEIIPYLEKNNIQFDLVLASPPYPLVEKNSYRDNLLLLFSSLYCNHITQPGGIMMLQHRKTDFKIPPEASYLELVDTRIYGDTQLSFFKMAMK